MTFKQYDFHDVVGNFFLEELYNSGTLKQAISVCLSLNREGMHQFCLKVPIFRLSLKTPE